MPVLVQELSCYILQNKTVFFYKDIVVERRFIC